MAVSQASFAMAVSGWRCRSTVRSVERVAGEADGKLVIRAGAARGNASVGDVGSRAAAAAAVVVGEVVAVAVAAAAAWHGERSR